jgi:gamma-glutamyl:cysteine ligase YbdK (ATP-grasp superfamily)
MEANLVDPTTFQSVPARQSLHSLVDRLADRGEELGCARYLQDLHELAEEPTGAGRQIRTFEESRDLAEVVRQGLSLTETADEPAH